MKLLAVVFVLLIAFAESHAQFNSEDQQKVDSLYRIVHHNSEPDTNHVNALLLLAEVYYVTQPDSATIFCERAEHISEKLSYEQGLSDSYGWLGYLNQQKGDYVIALEYFKKALVMVETSGDTTDFITLLNNIGGVLLQQGNLTEGLDYLFRVMEIGEEIGDSVIVVHCIGNIGYAYNSLGDMPKALDYFFKGLKINEELGDHRSIAINLNNIGSIYDDQDDYPNALKYYQRALAIQTEIRNESSKGHVLSNIGAVYSNMGDIEMAKEYYLKSLTISEALGDFRGMAHTYSSMGEIEMRNGNLSKSLEYQNLSLKMRKGVNDILGVARCLYNIGRIEVLKGNFSKASQHLEEALKLAQERNALQQISIASEALCELRKRQGRYKEAMLLYELHIQMRDSLTNERTERDVIRQEYKFTYEKQAELDSIKALEQSKVQAALLLAQEAETEKNKLEADHHKRQGYYLYTGLGLALLFGGFIFNRFKVTSKQKIIIEEQKAKVDTAFDELEEKNIEILDSIKYAKRIQNAILPTQKVVKEYLQESFILYKPKDIVAGDFYWLEQKDGKVLFAAADCTGHGVPGAMVSVVCNNGLNRSVREYGLTDPGQILDKTREIVLEEFEKSEEDVKDGMDIALCSLEGNKLQYAGAHNPLWIIRTIDDGSNEKVLIETKANKEPIGQYAKRTPYSTHTFDLQKGDSIYIFSDGFVDQFGGEKGKKFKAQAFRELLLSIQDKNMEDQKILIDETFESWRGDLEQIDDVCVIGVRV